MVTLVRFMQRHATGKLVLVLFSLTMAVYSTMLLYSIPAVMAFSPQLPIFDLSPFGYSFNYATELLTALGSEGRDIYLSIQLPLDFIYPGLFSITYALLLVWLLGKTCNAKSRIYYSAWIPFSAGIFDYIENLFIINMITSFPNLQVSTVNIASLFTLLKSSFTMLFFLVLTIAFVLLLKQKLINRNSKL